MAFVLKLMLNMLRMAAKLEQMGDKQEAKRLATAALKLNSKVG